jgi:hypothetical protein
MAKLSKQQAKLHQQAMGLVHSDKPLKQDDRWFIAENYREDAEHINGVAGAFFTPLPLANDFCMGINYGDSFKSVVDLCAGIGNLSLPCYERMPDKSRLTLVEVNPDYVAVGKRIMPEANWIAADVLDLKTWWNGEQYGIAISNSPFGNVTRERTLGIKFKANSGFEFLVMELAAAVAEDGAFIIPQMSAPFKYSGSNGFIKQLADKYTKFSDATGIVLDLLISVDCNAYLDDWHGVRPVVELVTFAEAV